MRFCFRPMFSVFCFSVPCAVLPWQLLCRVRVMWCEMRTQWTKRVAVTILFLALLTLNL